MKFSITTPAKTGIGLLALCLILNPGTAAHAGPPPILPRTLRGAEAVQALGERLPGIAAAHGLTAGQLRDILSRDLSLGVDRAGRLFYSDPDLGSVGGAASTDSATTPEALAPLENTFLLHSRPGAKRITFLDFDGHLLSGTAWNSSYNNGNDIVCPAWDIGGNPAVFDDTERTIIQQIWQRVAEDFAPFDVDVTTEFTGEDRITRSSSGDEYYGMRVLISPISSYVGNYGGVAYVGSFNDVGDYYKPALVFPEKLANSEKYIAEAVSHETGHTVGLSHDGKTDGTAYYSGHGTGETGWAPIMGVGYYKNLSQWSKGEYALANNTQDDLAIIATYVAYRADDHGNDNLSATILPPGSTVSTTGVIERNTDRDVFRFQTGAGNITFNVAAFERGPNLDVVAELYDSDGNLVAMNNPANLLGTSLNLTVAAGAYFLHIRGTGNGDPLGLGYTAYGSLGQYIVSGTIIDATGSVPPIAVATASPSSGDAPLAAQFSSAQSSDTDGLIVAYAWDFGDGTTSAAANPAHTFNAVGNYNVILVVTDDDGLMDATTIAVSALLPNTAPIANATATPNSGYAPLVVTLDGAGSFDSDGSIVSYQWNFGDGSTGSGATVSHTYQNPGSYTATLTVTDNRGATSSAAVSLQAQQDPNKVMRVATISLAAVTVAGGKQVKATVKITNPSNQIISGATVTGQFSGAVTGTGSATTDASGNAVITSRKLKKGTVTFTVTGVAKSGNVYNPAQNLVTSATIVAAGAF